MMVLLHLVCNFQFVRQIDPFLLIAGVKREKKDHFEDMLVTNFSAEEIEVCHGLLLNVNRTLADSSFGELTSQILQGRGKIFDGLKMVVTSVTNMAST